MYLPQFNATHLQHMLQLQDQAQTGLLGADWIDPEITTKTDFPTAVSDELGELANHLGFKWWKATDVDIRQAKMELVDMYHFIMCEIMQQHYRELAGYGDYTQAAKRELRAQAVAAAGASLTQGLNRTSREMLRVGGDGKPLIHDFNTLPEDHRRQRLLSTLRTMNTLLDPVALVGLSTITGGELDIDIDVTERCAAVGRCFYVAMMMLGMSFSELYLLYIGKHALNLFRWENGYKDGSYVKQWSEGAESREDNEVMHAYIDTLLKLDNLDPTNDYHALITKHLTSKYKVAKANAKAA